MGGLTPIGAIGLGSSFLEYTNYLLLHPDAPERHASRTTLGIHESSMSKYHELPTAFLWALLAVTITTSASTNITAIETACDEVLGHYLLVDGMTSDRACVGPVERGVWRWGVTTTN